MVRLNRRVLYGLGAVLVAVGVVGLVALRAQAPPAVSDAGPVPLPGAPAGERWFDKVLDRELGPTTTVDPPLAAGPAQRAVAQAPPSPAPVTPTPVDVDAQRQERALRTALSAPIAVPAFEARTDRSATASGPGLPRSGAAGVGSPAAPRAADGAAGQAEAAGDGKRTEPTPEILQASLRGSLSPYEVKAGTIIPGVMLTGINSDLPGQTTAQVRENVFDTVSGQYLLIPQGTRLVGLYDHHLVAAQERLLISWKRLLFPNGTSLSLREGMPGTDPLGAAGFTDEVNNHTLRVFGSALLLSIISAGIQLSQIPQYGQNFQGPSAGRVSGRSPAI